MLWIDRIHRWTGVVIGLLLAALGLSGTLLIYEDAWLRATVPGASAPRVQNIDATIDVAERLLATEDARLTGLLFPKESLGLYRLTFEEGAGAYADQSGVVVARWTSKWDRLELWLFELHDHLLLGEVGSVAGGVLALIGLGFVITGVMLWWRSRKSFSVRVLPVSFSRYHIVRHHRDLGAWASPLLVLALLTGAMLTLRPVADWVLAPFSAPGTIAESLAPPDVAGGPLAANFDWGKTLRQVHRTYPSAELRTISVPNRAGQLVRIRVRQPTEWLPNGRTVFWFDGADGKLIEARDAHSLPLAGRAFNLVYPLHAAMVGGWIYTAAMTIAGIALTFLGSFAVWSFGGFQLRRAAQRSHSAIERVERSKA
jgi:uncharacterized iron-regulated membrane protein